MLPTYLEADLFLGKSPFVQKPSFGREGDTITIRDKDTNIMIQNAHETYKIDCLYFRNIQSFQLFLLKLKKELRSCHMCLGLF